MDCGACLARTHPGASQANPRSDRASSIGDPPGSVAPADLAPDRWLGVCRLRSGVRAATRYFNRRSWRVRLHQRGACGARRRRRCPSLGGPVQSDSERHRPPWRNVHPDGRALRRWTAHPHACWLAGRDRVSRLAGTNAPPSCSRVRPPRPSPWPRGAVLARRRRSWRTARLGFLIDREHAPVGDQRRHHDIPHPIQCHLTRRCRRRAARGQSRSTVICGAPLAPERQDIRQSIRSELLVAGRSSAWQAFGAAGCLHGRVAGKILGYAELSAVAGPA